MYYRYNVVTMSYCLYIIKSFINCFVIEDYNNKLIWGTEWPSGLRRRVRGSRRWFDTSAAGGIFLRAIHGVRRTSHHLGHGRNLWMPH